MTSPSLYKYLDVQGARLTLANRCFRHAKPSEFNDTEELTIRSLFPEDDQTALDQIESNFTDVLVKHIDETPTCISEQLRQKVAVLQAVFKANPTVASIIKEAKKDLPSVFNLEHMKRRHRDFVDEINAFMQGFRVLCVSSRKDSDRMWCRYAEDHRGIVLKISPNVDKDSKYKLFRPVSYKLVRPTLYESALSFQEESLFGDQDARIKAAMEKVIYSKTLEWEYEHEYRLAIPVGTEDDWKTLSYHPEEISEIYFGASASDEWKAEAAALAVNVNPQITIHEMFYSANGNLLARYSR